MLFNRTKKILADAIKDIEDMQNAYSVNPSKKRRKRKLSIGKVLTTMTRMQKGTLGDEIDTAGLGVTPQAFVQYRKTISSVACADLFHRTAKAIAAECSYASTYKGFHILAGDGSKCTLGPFAESRFSYVDKAGEMHREVVIHGLYDASAKVFVDAMVTPIQTDERTAMAGMIDRYDGSAAIFTADRGYPSYNIIEHLRLNSRLEFLMRVPNSHTFKEIGELPMEEADNDVQVTVCDGSTQICALHGYRHVSGESPFGKPKKSVTWDFGREPCTIKFRVCRFLVGNTWETVITSLPRDRFSLQEIRDLYAIRWGIEVAFRHLKHAVDALYFHGRKDEAIIKELYCSLVSYNLASAVANSVELEQKDGLKYKYHINMTNAAKKLLPLLCDFSSGEICENELIALLKRYLLPYRPGRKRPRPSNCSAGRKSYQYR